MAARKDMEQRTTRSYPARDRAGRRTLKQIFAAVMAAGSLIALGGAVAAGASSDAPSSDGHSVTSYRRLSQDQYSQTIADIFGSDIKISGRLEPDPRRDGLIAFGVSDASVSATGFEQYDAAAREIARRVTDPAHRDILIGCAPQNAASADDACARAFLTKTGRLLYRRPLDPTESETFVALAGKVAATKGDFYSGLGTSLAAMLESPKFLFRTERAVSDGTSLRLDDYSVATRLSFLIWNAPPDEALLDAAARGDLATSAGTAKQVDRMLASPRFEHGVRAFFSDMLSLDDLDGLQKDP